MKKCISRLLVMVFLLGCLGAQAELGPDAVIGTWYLNAMEMDGASINPAVFGMEMAVVIHEDGTALLQAPEEEDGIAAWSVQGDTLTLVASNDDEDAMVFSYVDGELVIEEEGMKMLFGKEKGAVEATEIAPAREATDIAEFDGEWVATFLDMDGTQMPMALLGMGMQLVIADGTVRIVLDDMEEDTEEAQPACLKDGALAVDFALFSIDATEKTIHMHEDGTLSFEVDELGTVHLEKVSVTE